MLAMALVCASDADAAEKLKALIVDGQNNHEVWPKSTIMMKQYLEETGMYEVKVERTKFIWKSNREKDWLPKAGAGESEDKPQPMPDPDFNPDLVKALIQELKARHIHLCIDDFGTGYSSLSRLNDFPISTLKIDRSFVKDLGALGENSEIIQTIVNLAHTLRMDVVAEGIEFLEQVSPLIAMRCQYGQGYLFSKPLNSEAASKFLSNQ